METLFWRRFAKPDESCHVARKRYAPRESMRPHQHDDFVEVFWLESGTLIHAVGERSRHLETRDVVYVRREDGHAYRGTGDGAVIVNVAISTATRDRLAGWYFDGDRSFWGGADPMPRTVRIPEESCGALAAGIAPLLQGPRDRLAADRFLLDLLTLAPPPRPAGPWNRCPDWLRSACERLGSPEIFPEGTKALSRLTGRTQEHIARVLKQTAGKTPSEVVNAARMAWAAGQLAATDRTILDLALDCGFRSLSHFYRVFRKYHGKTPRRYRMEARGLLPG